MKNAAPRPGHETYRPNSRSISQPSNPLAASGRVEVRVGAGLLEPLAGSGVPGAICEAICGSMPPDCAPGNAATGTP